MWIYLPTDSSQSAQEQVDSISELSEEATNELSQSATWRTKAHLQRFWQRVWKTNEFLPRLFGRTLTRSILKRGEALKVLQADILARRSTLEGRDWEPPIPDIYGLLLQEESSQLNLFGASSKTSTLICDMDFLRSPKSFTAWVILLRRHSLKRRMLEHHINGRGFLFSESKKRLWMTPIGTDADKKHSGSLARQVDPSAFLTSRSHIHHDPRTKNGKPYQPTSNRLYLNPNFTEWMMGWDIGWTSVDKTASE